MTRVIFVVMNVISRRRVAVLSAAALAAAAAAAVPSCLDANSSGVMLSGAAALGVCLHSALPPRRALQLAVSFIHARAPGPVVVLWGAAQAAACCGYFGFCGTSCYATTPGLLAPMCVCARAGVDVFVMSDQINEPGLPRRGRAATASATASRRARRARATAGRASRAAR